MFVERSVAFGYIISKESYVIPINRNHAAKL